MSKESFMRNESIGRESGKIVEKSRKISKNLQVESIWKSTWIYEESTHWIYATKQRKRIWIYMKNRKRKDACWVWNKWKCTWWRDATLSYSNSPKPIGHNLAVIFASFLFFKICLVIPGQELLEVFQHAIALKEEAQVKTKWRNSTRTKRLFLA